MKFIRTLKHALVAATAVAALVPASQSFAQAGPAAGFPSRTIRFIVPYPPGGGNDLFARLIGQKLSENVGQPVVVDNRPGAAGLIAGDALAKAAPDGYTIMVDQSSIATNPLLYKKVPFDVRKDIAPVMWGATLDNAVLVNAQSPIRTVADLIAAAKAKPGKIAYGTGGFGSSQHLAMELFRAQAGVDLLHVPYKGTAAAVMAVSTDEVQVFLISAATAQGYIKAGKVRAIATTGAKRSPIMPDVPTMIEAGLPNYTNYNWLGIFTTAGTPQPVIDKLNLELVKALNDPGVKESLGKQGWNLVGGSPDSLRKLINDEMGRYEKIVREGGMQIDQP
jgi:tripartite-type tricarboxylate transporter receptor subunit TctC